MDHDDQLPLAYASPGPKAPQDQVVTRRHRGYAIYLQGGVNAVSENLWKVASQRVEGAEYTVKRILGRKTCNCKDFEERIEPCKHIFATDNYEAAEPRDSRLDKIISTRSTRDWREYNATKIGLERHVEQLLKDLAATIEDPGPQPGNQPAPISDLIFAVVMRTYIGESGRDFCGELQQRLVERGFLQRSYHFNTLSTFLRQPIAGNILKELIRETASPLASLLERKCMAIDSSGFATSSSSLWYDEKYGRARKRNFLKLHIACDTTTHIVTDAIVTDDTGADRAQLVPLLEGSLLRYKPDEVSADRAYASLKNYDAVSKAGAVPYLPPRGRMTGNGSALMKRMFHAFRTEDPDILKHYHKRSNVETVMYMIKVQFGDAVRARSVVGSTNELLSKVLCHNLACLAMAIARYKLEAKFFKAA